MTLRRLQPLLQIATPWWGSRPGPRRAFQIQRCLFYGTKREEEGFPYENIYRPRGKREELLRKLVFPRNYEPTLYRIWWTMKWTPLLLKTLVVLGVRYTFWRMRNPRPSGKEDVVVKSRIGRFFCDLFTLEEFHEVLNTTMQPWGFFAMASGRSMRPTFSGNPAITYASYAYVKSQDVSVGDVVRVLGPNLDSDNGVLCKRVAAIERARIYVNSGSYETREVREVNILLLLLSLKQRLSLIAIIDTAGMLLRSWG